MHDIPSPRQRLPKQFKKGRAAKDTSFLLQHRSEVIANNLSAVERGLFMGISFEELVMHNWGPQSHDLDVTDWMQYRTDAAQHRIQPSVQKEGGKDVLTSDVLAVRARFNLTVNFVASEIVLAHPSQRVVVFSKLVRIAWVRASLIFFNHRNTNLYFRVEIVPDEQLCNTRLDHRRTRQRLGRRGNEAALGKCWDLGDASFA